MAEAGRLLGNIPCDEGISNQIKRVPTADAICVRLSIDRRQYPPLSKFKEFV